MNLFSEEFAKYDVKAGQVLLTHAIFDNRSAYLNARNTLNTMLELGIIPVINENDSVAVEEIKLGDNDRLGALVALLTDADLYIMLSEHRRLLHRLRARIRCSCSGLSISTLWNR